MRLIAVITYITLRSAEVQLNVYPSTLTSLKGYLMKFAAICLALLPGVALAEGVEWAYSGEMGPENWGALDAGYEVCAKGVMQSPVDLAAANAVGELKLEPSYNAVPLKVTNTGHTILLDGQGGGAFTEAGVRFDLVQAHFHAPSEHTIDGKTYPAELHLVHKSESGDLAVLGVLIEEGAESDALVPLANAPKEVGGEAEIPGATFDAGAYLPKDAAIYRYSGSLTTPPCSEGVAWHVFQQPVTASAEQIAALTAAMGHENARPVQGLNGRLLVGPAE